MCGTVIERVFDAVGFKLHSQSKGNAELFLGTMIRLGRMLTHFAVMAKPEVKAKFETSLPEWTKTLRLMIVRNVGFKFEEALQLL